MAVRDGLHQQVGAIAPQVVKHHGEVVVLAFSRSLRLQALWAAPRYLPVMWQWSRTVALERFVTYVARLSGAEGMPVSPRHPHGLRIS